MLCCNQNFLEVVSQNCQAAKTGKLYTAKTNQLAMLDFLPIWILIFLHKTDPTVFTSVSRVKRAKFHLPYTIISWISLFVYAVYSPADRHC